MYRRCDRLWGGAYPGECDFSIGFLFARRASTMGDPTGLKGSIRLRRTLLWHGGNSLVRTSGASRVCLVHLVSLIQPNKPDRTEQTKYTRQAGGLFQHPAIGGYW